MRSGENSLQTAVMLALENFCNQINNEVLLFPPYPNQQGEGMRKYCGDLLGLLEDGRVILLEFKVLDLNKLVLTQFDSAQYEVNLSFEQLGVPIAYAYNTIPFPYPYHLRSTYPAWAIDTLTGVNRAQPSKLPNEYPAIPNHQTLLEWLINNRSEDITDNLGRVLGALRLPESLKNGILVLIYGVENHKLAALEPDQLVLLVDILNNSALSEKDQAKLKKILGEADSVFERFRKQHNDHRPPRRPG